jgi:hypothetical protein
MDSDARENKTLLENGERLSEDSDEVAAFQRPHSKPHRRRQLLCTISCLCIIALQSVGLALLWIRPLSCVDPSLGDEYCQCTAAARLSPAILL